MARWSEDRGYTLVLRHPRAPDRYARVVLVAKRTLFGQAFNVQEARAEDASRSGSEPESLGAGRMLSWRWLGKGEAEELLSARLHTLEALGYGVFGRGGQPKRGPWDWLRELVDRQLSGPAGSSGEGDLVQGQREILSGDRDRDRARRPGAEGLREALAHLGLDADALTEGIAAVVGLEPAELREPSVEFLRKLDPEILPMLLPFWLDHESAQLRAIGRRWLALGPTLYELELSLLETWAAGEGGLAAALADRLELEGLALLGPEGLARLAHRAIEPRTRAIALRWQQRLRPAARAPG